MSFWVGIGGSLGAVIIGYVFYGFQYGLGSVVCGLVCSTPSGFSSGLLFSVGVFGFRFPFCVCAHARALFGAFDSSTGEKIHFNRRRRTY